MVRKHQTPGAQLRTGESRDSGFMLRMPRNDKRNREPERAGFSPDCPSQMLAPRPGSGAVLCQIRSRFAWRETDMTGAQPALSRRLRHLAAAVTIGAASVMAAAPAFARGPDGIADIAEKVIDAVVNISTSQTVEAKGGGGGGGGGAMPQVPPGSPFEEFFDDFFKNRRGGPGGKGGDNG